MSPAGVVIPTCPEVQIIKANPSTDDVRSAVEDIVSKVSLEWEIDRRNGVGLEPPLPRDRHPDGAFDNSPRMRVIKEMIEQVADTDATVLVRGESGVGKELVSRAIHEGSPRRAHALVKVNCAALPLELLESELFGHERGAFTGAHRRKAGKFELADGGTIFLDEIGEMPLPLQSKLLHVLQAGEFSRLGGGLDLKVDVRVVASTNRDLERAVADGSFREDLYYRLNVVSIHVPPLRERPEEILILAEQFREKYSQHYRRAPVRLSPAMLGTFRAHGWPGNVRELENMVKRIVVLGSEVQATRDLAGASAPLATMDIAEPDADSWPAPPPWAPTMSLKEFSRRAVHEAERRVIKEVLDLVRWNRVEAARRLGISYKALLYKIRAYELGAVRQ
jgi:transcriptional regulator with GAF, ATPase, and Fis domain